MQHYLNLGPTKYKFKIFFYSIPILTCQQQATNIIIIYFPRLQFPKFNEHHTIFKNIYIASTSPSLFSFFFFFRLLPISKVVSSLQLPVCNSHHFFFFPSIYVCNNTSRVKAGTPLFHFLNYFFHFLSLNSLSSTGRNLYFSRN